MNLNFKRIWCLIILCFCAIGLGWAQTPAFPGAEGFGMYTTGGRGGNVYHVTSLADDGSEGTLRWALNQSGKKTIVFDVSGTIHLTKALSVGSYTTIAGQTAPGDGICVADYPFTLSGSQIIIRYMRFRLGNVEVANHEGDGLGGMDGKDAIVDHCSISWSIDECCSIYGWENLSVQWCIVSQSLCNSGHSKGSHGYGGNWGGKGATYHHNLLCHHGSRTPRLGPRQTTQTDERLDLRNNVIYNWAGNGCYGGEGMNVNIVANYYKPGPATLDRSTTIQKRIAAPGVRTLYYCISSINGEDTVWNGWAPMLHKWGTFYLNGNYNSLYPEMDEWKEGLVDQIDKTGNDRTFNDEVEEQMHLSEPIGFLPVTTHTAAVAYEKVLALAGANLSRDWVDTLMVYDTRNGVASYGKKGIIDSQDDNKPEDAAEDWNAWPTLEQTELPLDTDQDGMPDAWEEENGLDPTDASDRNTLNADGYTMLEVYMNSLVADITAACLADGEVLSAEVKSDEEEEGDEPAGNKYVLSGQTYTGSSSSTVWQYTDVLDFEVSNENGKGYSTGKESCVKHSINTQFTISWPATTAIKGVEFYGYNNYAGTDAFIREVNGVSLDSTMYTFPQKDAAGNMTYVTNRLNLETPAEGSMTMTFAGKQVVLIITLYENAFSESQLVNYPAQSSSAVSGIKATEDGVFDVYNLQGQLVRKNATAEEAEGLPTGIYVGNGRTFVVLK